MTLAYVKGIEIDYLDLRSYVILTTLANERTLDYRKEELKAVSNINKDNSSEVNNLLAELYKLLFPWSEEITRSKKEDEIQDLINQWKEIEGQKE